MDNRGNMVDAYQETAVLIDELLMSCLLELHEGIR